MKKSILYKFLFFNITLLSLFVWTGQTFARDCPEGQEWYAWSGKCLKKCRAGWERDSVGVCQPKTKAAKNELEELKKSCAEGTVWNINVDHCVSRCPMAKVWDSASQSCVSREEKEAEAKAKQEAAEQAQKEAETKAKQDAADLKSVQNKEIAHKKAEEANIAQDKADNAQLIADELAAKNDSKAKQYQEEARKAQEKADKKAKEASDAQDDADHAQLIAEELAYNQSELNNTKTVTSAGGDTGTNNTNTQKNSTANINTKTGSSGGTNTKSNTSNTNNKTSNTGNVNTKNSTANTNTKTSTSGNNSKGGVALTSSSSNIIGANQTGGSSSSGASSSSQNSAGTKYEISSSAGGQIWDTLATKAGKIGAGLQRIGYIIAGLGLIFFSFMAIFNKISWKNLAYIMLSCFVLTLMVALINYFSQTGDPQTENLKFQGPDADTSFTGGIQEAGGTQPGMK